MLAYFLACSLILNASLPVAQALVPGDLDPLAPATGVLAPIAFGPATVIDTDHGAIINWTNFDTLVGESVEFNQTLGGLANSTSTVLNRITSGVGTQFDGALIGNGRVFVVNGAGIIFGGTSTVNVTQLVASGLNMSDTAFNNALDPANDLVFSGGDGVVMNLGTVQADSIILVGSRVVNGFQLLASDGGLVVLAAGESVYIAQDGSNVLVDVSGVNGSGLDDVVNGSRIRATNGTIVLAAGDTFSRAVRNSGLLTANGGDVTFRAAIVENEGTVSVSGAGGGDAGTVTLSGVDEVRLTRTFSYPPTIEANGGENGDGGSITLESPEGTVTLEESTISAVGGSTSGDGGSISITAENFVIAGEIDASPGNTDYEPGTLEINSPSVIIANGANAGATNTIYEQDIEALSEKGTSIVINSEQGITVPDIVDGEIKGRYGNIELYGTGQNSFVSFADTTDTISTTLGDIIIGAGSGGLNIGNLETAGDPSATNPTPAPGQIILSASDRGDITVEDLLIKDGWGHAEINITASGQLTVNGNILVGGVSPIFNVPNGQDAEAFIFLKSGDNMYINGNVTAYAQGINAGVAGGITKAYVGIFAGTNETWFGNLTINGDLTAKAISSDVGTSEATVEIDSWGSLTWGPDAADPLADGDAGDVHVESKESEFQTIDGDIAQIIVNIQGHSPEIDGVPDFATTHMGTLVEGDVTDNDAHPAGEVLGAMVAIQPSHAESFTFDGGGNYTYVPEEGFVGEDTFTYVTYSVLDRIPTDPILVTITMTNSAPVPEDITATAHMGAIYAGSVANNVSDPDNDPFTIALAAGPGHGTVTVNSDGTYGYLPEAGYVGDDTFTYSAVDGEIGAQPVEATVTITMINSAPTATADVARTRQELPAVINVLANDSDPEGDALTISSVTYTGSGTVTINANNTLTYTPGKNFVGNETFTYSATDGQLGGTPVTATVTVVVAPTMTLPPAYFMPTGPDLDKTDVRISGCPALTAWAAQEIGVGKRRMDIWIGNGLASTRGVQPCDACTNLQEAAKILADARGIHAAAVRQIIEEFGSNSGPITEDMAAYITNAMAHDSGTRTHYAIADEYFSALSEYVGILHNDMGLSVDKAARIVADKYIDRLAASGDTAVASYVAARLDSVSTFFTVVRLNRGKEISRIR